MPAFLSSSLRRPLAPLARIALSHYVTNGLAAALGLLLISSLIRATLGEAAAAVASVGVMVCVPPDHPAPKHHKLWQLVPSALIGLPLFAAVQWLHDHPVLLGLLLVPATFVAFLAGAWGKRGLPISMSIMFAVVFSMAVSAHASVESLTRGALHFGLGAGLYLLYATAVNALLNPRYRVQMLVDTLLALAALLRAQAQQFTPLSAGQEQPLLGEMLRQQAALADQLQTARDILLEAPRTARRQRLAGLLMGVLELRDHVLACELDLDALRGLPRHAPALEPLRQVVLALAQDVERLADDLLLGRTPQPFTNHRATLAALHWDEDQPLPDTGDGWVTRSPAVLVRSLANRVGHLNDDTQRLCALARGEADPDLDVVRASWQMFISPTAWSWQPLRALWHWQAPPLRHATRGALAIAVGYAIAVAVPWGTHDYWVLLTIVVVLRGSLAQTLERRNHRVGGTLLGCVLAAGVLALHLPGWALLLLMTIAQAVAHAFAVRRYMVAAIGATVMGLVQAHMLGGGLNPAGELVERIADTLLGVALAWGFSYVLPSWERQQIPSLVARTLAAQARHARKALDLAQFSAVDDEAELAWRLARREAYDSLSALVQATQRSLVEPRAVRPPLEPLGRLLAHSYQLLAQLTMLKTMLVLFRPRLQLAQLTPAMTQASAAIEAALAPGTVTPHASGGNLPDLSGRLPDPFKEDLSPWALRRLQLAQDVALQLREDAGQVLHPPGA